MRPLEARTDGPPRTVWALAGLLIGMLPVYSWAFKTWDGSDLPETFGHPLYRLGVAVLFVVAAVWALLLRNRGSWIDRIIIAALFLIAVGACWESAFVRRETIPPESKFTVAVFKFVGDSDAAKNAAAGFRGMVREREIKGETPDEKLAFARKWALRVAGCHLAVWMELHIQPNGTDYDGVIYYVKAYPFGKEIQTDKLGHFQAWADTFTATPVGPERSLGQGVLDRTIDSVLFYWGLASYRKGDYDTALRVLPAGRRHAE